MAQTIQFRLDAKYLPWHSHALEGMRPAVCELQAGAIDELANAARDQDLCRTHRNGIGYATSATGRSGGVDGIRGAMQLR